MSMYSNLEVMTQGSFKESSVESMEELEFHYKSRMVEPMLRPMSTRYWVGTILA